MPTSKDSIDEPINPLHLSEVDRNPTVNEQYIEQLKSEIEFIQSAYDQTFQ